jgi:hypothetical protein
MVSTKVALLPVCTVPKSSNDGLALRAPGVTPVPDSGIAKVAALLMIDRLPLELPEDWGAKTTLKLALWFADNVSGNVNPVRLYPEPVRGAWVIVTFDPPVLVMVSARVTLLLVCTLPKLSDEGATVSAPGAAPVPDICMTVF